jgi:hypothetical protein
MVVPMRDHAKVTESRQSSSSPLDMHRNQSEALVAVESPASTPGSSRDKRDCRGMFGLELGCLRKWHVLINPRGPRQDA